MNSDFNYYTLEKVSLYRIRTKFYLYFPL